MRAGPPRYLRENVYRLLIQAYILAAASALSLTGQINHWLAAAILAGNALWAFLFRLGWRGDYD